MFVESHYKELWGHLPAHLVHITVSRAPVPDPSPGPLVHLSLPGVTEWLTRKLGPQPAAGLDVMTSLQAKAMRANQEIDLGTLKISVLIKSDSSGVNLFPSHSCLRRKSTFGASFSNSG